MCRLQRYNDLQFRDENCYNFLFFMRTDESTAIEMYFHFFKLVYFACYVYKKNTLYLLGI